MSKSKPELSYSSLIYLFPAAVWVNQSTTLFSGDFYFSKIYLALLFFCFIPAEVYATNLWDKDRTGDKSLWTNGANIIGVFFLSILYLGYPSLNDLYIKNESIDKASTLFIGLGMLLIFNFLWNAIERPKDENVFSSFDTIIQNNKKPNSKTKEVLFNFAKKLSPKLQKINLYIALTNPVIGIILIIIVMSGDDTGFLGKFHMLFTGKISAIAIISFLSWYTLWKFFHGFIFYILELNGK